jgi:hypothetical protein
MSNIIPFPQKTKVAQYSDYLDTLTNFQMFDEMMKLVAMNVDTTDLFELEIAHTFWKKLKEKAFTDELALVASSIEQDYRYKIKDLTNV